jgi:hypothetical protein
MSFSIYPLVSKACRLKLIVVALPQRALKAEAGMSSHVTELMLIRHGETDWNVERRLQGQCQPGPPLNETGCRQTEVVRQPWLFQNPTPNGCCHYITVAHPWAFDPPTSDQSTDRPTVHAALIITPWFYLPTSYKPAYQNL